MNYKKKKVLKCIVLAILLMNLSHVLCYGTSEPIIEIDSKVVTFQNSNIRPYIDEYGEVIVPVRTVAEAFDSKVSWNPERKEILCTKNDIFVTFNAGRQSYKWNNEELLIDKPVKIKDGSSYISLRVLMDALGGSVQWNKALNLIKIKDAYMSYHDEWHLPYEGKLIYKSRKEKFNYPYLIYIPDDLEKDKDINLIVNCVNTGRPEYRVNKLYSSAIDLFSLYHYNDIAKETNSVVMIALIERPMDEMQTYTHALDSDSIKISNQSYSKIQNQFHQMIVDCKNYLEYSGYDIEEKVITYGFSASGQFAHRYAFLYPQDVKLVVAGGIGGQITIPAKSHNGEALPYPVGVNNISNFDFNGYKEVQQLIFQGDHDNNPCVGENDGYEKEELSAIEKITGYKVKDINNSTLLETMGKIHGEYSPSIKIEIIENTAHNISEAALDTIIKYINERK